MKSLPKILIGTNALDYATLSNTISVLKGETIIALDTSPNYQTERTIGSILSELRKEKEFNREEFFIQTKLEFIDQCKGQVEKAFYKSLSLLGVEYIDSYLMHWPNPDTFVDDWKILEKIYKQGLVRNIGVCNFRLRHWRKLFDSNIEILPHINQIEIHPLRTCDKLLDFCNTYGINTQAYSPICKMIAPIRDNIILNQLANKYHISIPELILAWHVSRGVSPITKSSTPVRVKNNIESALSISHELKDISAISSLDIDYKYFLESWGCPGF